MKNINEYFNDLYAVANTDEKWEEVNEYEIRVYKMESEEFHKWAEDNNVDLNAIGAHGHTELSFWYWDMAEDEYYPENRKRG